MIYILWQQIQEVVGVKHVAHIHMCVKPKIILVGSQ